MILRHHRRIANFWANQMLSSAGRARQPPRKVYAGTLEYLQSVPNALQEGNAGKIRKETSAVANSQDIVPRTDRRTDMYLEPHSRTLIYRPTSQYTEMLSSTHRHPMSWDDSNNYKLEALPKTILKPWLAEDQSSNAGKPCQ